MQNLRRTSPPSLHTTPHLQQDHPALHLHPLILHFLVLEHQRSPIKPSSRRTWLHKASPSIRVSRCHHLLRGKFHIRLLPMMSMKMTGHSALFVQYRNIIYCFSSHRFLEDIRRAGSLTEKDISRSHLPILSWVPFVSELAHSY